MRLDKFFTCAGLLSRKECSQAAKKGRISVNGVTVKDASFHVKEESDEILLDGVDIREYDYDSYLEQISAVFQDYQLFAMSLKDNVALALPVEDGRITAVLRQVGLEEMLDGLPRGIHTHVTKLFEEDGFEPSGGEGQKIALARALYRDAPIVVLDEPTAALDPRSEYELYRQFDQLVEGKTAVYISHRLSSARFCDRVAVFRQGRLIELDTHETLMARAGEYAKLFALQAQYYA